MFLLVTPMRVKGRALTMEQIRAAEPLAGDVRLEMVFCSDLHRNAVVAWVEPGQPMTPEPLTRLLDAQLLTLAEKHLVISGIERAADGAMHAQSWWCRQPTTPTA